MISSVLARTSKHPEIGAEIFKKGVLFRILPNAACSGRNGTELTIMPSYSCNLFFSFLFFNFVTSLKLVSQILLKRFLQHHFSSSNLSLHIYIFIFVLLGSCVGMRGKTSSWLGIVHCWLLVTRILMLSREPLLDFSPHSASGSPSHNIRAQDI